MIALVLSDVPLELLVKGDACQVDAAVSISSDLFHCMFNCITHTLKVFSGNIHDQHMASRSVGLWAGGEHEASGVVLQIDERDHGLDFLLLRDFSHHCLDDPAVLGLATWERLLLRFRARLELAVLHELDGTVRERLVVDEALAGNTLAAEDDKGQAAMKVLLRDRIVVLHVAEDFLHVPKHSHGVILGIVAVAQRVEESASEGLEIGRLRGDICVLFKVVAETVESLQIEVDGDGEMLRVVAALEQGVRGVVVSSSFHLNKVFIKKLTQHDLSIN